VVSGLPELYIGVCGPGMATARPADLRAAEEVGRLVAEAGGIVVCGGLGGVMEAACRGARSAGGVAVGLLPTDERRTANPFVSVAIPTGLGELRNGLVVRAADAVVAIGGEWGTLSEIALAIKAGTPVVGVDTWDLGRGEIEVAPDAGAAVARALVLARAHI
jgi:uncharacterized protein (TIGR00725 family)